MAVLENKPESEKELFKMFIPENAEAGIEIGVLFGDTSRFFLENFKKLHLHGIDPVIPDSMEASLIGDLEKIEENTRLYRGRFTFHFDYSYNVFEKLEDGAFDFVFIDGSHHYEDVKNDYELFSPKIKKGGLIFFHDSRMNRGGAPFHVGPSKFVDELILLNEHELIGEAFSLTCFKK